MQKHSKKDQTDREKNIRELERRDRSRIEEMIVSSGKFNEVEIKTALELVDEALEEGEASGYIFVFQDVRGRWMSLLWSNAPYAGGV